MLFPRVKRREGGPSGDEGVYADLSELVRLQFKTGGFSFLPRQPVQSILAGRRSSRLRGRGLDFEEIRAYLPGDDIRNIDWKITARLGKPHTRVYTEEKDRPVMLVVDQRLSMFFGSRTVMKSVAAAEAAALVAWRAFEAGDRAGAIVFNDGHVVEIPPHRSRERVMRILRTVVKMNGELRTDGDIQPNPAVLNKVLEKVLQIAHHDYLVAVVSDFNGVNEQTRGLVTRISAHNDVLVLFVHDPLEARLPDAGKLIVSQGDLQLEIDTGDPVLRKRFSHEFETRLKRARDLMLRRAVPVLPILTTGGVAEQFRDLLGRPSAKQ